MKKIIAIIALLFITPSSAFAQWVVNDPANLVQNINQVAQTIEQINRLKLQYERQFEQLQKAAQQVSAMTGARGMGLLLNSAANLDDRRYTPQTWQDTLMILKKGGSPGSQKDVKDIYKTMRVKYKIANRQKISPKNPDSPRALNHELTTQTTLANFAVSEKAFNLSNKRIKNYETLLAEIEKTADLKAAQDLANRIAIENGMTINELNKLLATQMQLKAAQSNQDLIDRTNAARLNTFVPSKITATPTK